ncbi:MAG: MAPEG family protein [Gammaproteobacteria bacterium]|nr:MAPEG family protein [Gammaproteobacteria bacterium]MDH5729365.1 MAPEG family protein [Gammaproteobacteria bacterium]
MIASPDILFPALALMGLTACVWLWMLISRKKALQQSPQSMQVFATQQQTQTFLQQANLPAENFSNLFELPVIFYVMCLMLFVTQHSSFVFLVLAWSFVILRTGHSLVHIFFNHVIIRFVLYLLSSVMLWLIVILFAMELFDY